MFNNIQSIKGMHDYLPKELILWNKIEKVLKKILSNYNYFEIRFPILEKTELFQKTLGEITDVIEKEMYSFYDKNNNSITLRPEGTIGCARSVIQHGLLHHKKPKLWYYGPMFRYERPQKGRYRQFYQLGIETFGFLEPDMELELIMLINRCWKILNISHILNLEINLIGSIQSRVKYQKVLKNFLMKNFSNLDSDCIRKLHTNPFRILDSKNKNIQKLLVDAPVLIDYVDKDARNNFDQLCDFMEYFNIAYNINHRLIRGLDYYNNTVFEWKTNLLGSQDTVCAGGRYDTLIEKLGGKSIPGCGLAIGMDRLLLLIDACSNKFLYKYDTDIFIFFSVKKIKLLAISLSENIRDIFPNIKILVELEPICKKKIFKNIKKYSCHIILFLESEEIKNKKIMLYDLKKKVKNSLLKSELINTLKLIFNKK